MPKFMGFDPKVIQFLEAIKHNNNKQWFTQRYDFYQQEILEISRDLVEDLGAELQKIAPDINIIPKVNGSIYRFSRDARFSKDKTPYKSHLSYLFWQGTLKRTQCPGFYLSIRPEYIQLGVGVNHFTPDYLQAWRQQCAHKKQEKKIYHVFDRLIKSGAAIYGEQLKRMPRGYSTELLNQELIRYKGLKCYYQITLPKEVYSADFIPLCCQYYQQLLPMFNWMVAILNEFTIESK